MKFMLSTMIRCTLLLPLLYGTLSHAQSFQGLTIMTEEFPPFNFSDRGKAAGRSVNLLVEASAAVGQPISVEDITIAAWARAYKSAVSGPNTVLFSTVRNAEREPLFKWAGPIGVNRLVIWAKKSSEIDKIEDLTTLATKILVVRDSIGDQQMTANKVPANKIFRVSKSDAAAKMLANDRVKLWVYNEATAIELLERIGEDINDYHAVYVLKASDLYFAFSRDVDDSVVDLLQRGIDLVKK